MDGAKASHRYAAVAPLAKKEWCATSRRAWRFFVRKDKECGSRVGVSLGRTASSADLGGSSKYSNESFED